MPTPSNRRLRAWCSLLCVAGLLALAGCAAPPARPLPADVTAAWQTHRALLTEITRWHLRGSLAVKAGGEGGQANMDWHQRADDYDIRLSGPMGSGGVRLNGDGEGATLRLGSGERRTDTDPARLLFNELGWWIPVDSLRYWALGLPDPALPADVSLDEYGRLASLVQDGWRVRFDSYRPEGALDLPERVVITGQDAEVRFVARHWTIEPAARAQ